MAAPKKKKTKKATRKKATGKKAAAVPADTEEPENTGRARGDRRVTGQGQDHQKVPGGRYVVKASVGHIKDLPKSKLSIDIDNGFAPHYEVIRGKSKVVKEIKDAARGARRFIWRPTRIAKARRLPGTLPKSSARRHASHTYRITFNEITKKAVQAAIANPQALDANKFASQQARRILDRLVGYQISPILWDKVPPRPFGRASPIGGGASDRRARTGDLGVFVPEEYWSNRRAIWKAPAPGFCRQCHQKGRREIPPRR